MDVVMLAGSTLAYITMITYNTIGPRGPINQFGAPAISERKLNIVYLYLGRIAEL